MLEPRQDTTPVGDSGRGSPSLNTSVSGPSSTLHSLESSSRLLFTSSSLPRTTAQEYRSFWCLLCTANVSLGGHFAIKVPFIPQMRQPSEGRDLRESSERVSFAPKSYEALGRLAKGEATTRVRITATGSDFTPPLVCAVVPLLSVAVHPERYTPRCSYVLATSKSGTAIISPERSGTGLRCGELPEGPVVLSSLFDCLSLHLPSPSQYVFTPAPQHVRGCDVSQGLVVAPVVVVADEGRLQV